MRVPKALSTSYMRMLILVVAILALVLYSRLLRARVFGYPARVTVRALGIDKTGSGSRTRRCSHCIMTFPREDGFEAASVATAIEAAAMKERCPLPL
mmetsp:Transcript_39270/g.66842  ORF Transcript_39270/g.66842 Transcript_39270/m.66842 type:complete len:97 (-) Transcript_39270:342-632(-)